MEVLDWVVLIGYAATVIFIGWRAGRGTRSGIGHLRAERSLPGWAVVFSILATEISAATYIGVPETGYNGNWTYLQFAIGALLAKIVLATGFIRLYWRLNLTTVYGFLGQRIGPRTQTSTAWAFLGGRLVASAVRLYIAAIAFSVVAGLPTEVSIAVMAVISTAYTFVGGLKAVVWTDVAQGCIFALGAATAIAVGLIEIGQPIGTLFDEALAAGKLQILSIDPGKKGWLVSLETLPIAVLGGFFLGLATHGTDQENVQHLLNTRTQRASVWSIVSSGLFTFPVVALFLTVGPMLWHFHRYEAVTAYDPNDARRIFPNFIMHVMPMGLRGLVFAGLFAAAISSLGATLNAVTTAWLNDIRKLRDPEAQSLARVRVLTCIFGVLLLGLGVFFKWYSDTQTEKLDLVQIALSAMTILYGGILGTFLTALLTRSRGSDVSARAGLAVGIATGALLFFHQLIFRLNEPLLVWPFYIPISATLTILVSCLGKRRTSAPEPAPAAVTASGR